MGKRRHEEEENHERWLVSYADFITLLFAFFVVMYAISSVNVGKYRVLSETLTEAFQDKPVVNRGTPVGVEEGGAIIAKPEAGLPIDQQEAEARILSEPEQIVQQQPVAKPIADTNGAADQQEGSSGQLAGIAQALMDKLGGVVDPKLVSVDYNERWVEVNLDSSLLFETGASRLSRNALRALKEISKVLRPLPNELNVEGYTDNIPIRSREFPSNWELSAARAASVVHFLARLGIDPGRLAAVGFGEHRPLADNDTPEGRAKNRRVTLLIMAANEGASRGSLRTTATEAGQ